jgi:MATE family multidrug resistance protein
MRADPASDSPIEVETHPKDNVPDVAEAAFVPMPSAPQLPPSAIGSGGGIGRQVFILALPMLGEQFFTFLVGFVDTWLAGQISKEVQAAVGTGAYMSWFVGLIVSLVGTGASALVSRSIGARDGRTANRTATQALILAFALGGCMTLVAETLAGPLAARLAQTEEARRHLLTFIRIDALGYILFSVLLVCGGVMRAAGDTRTPMKVQIVVNIVNAGLAALLIFGWPGPSWGVVGIAVATCTARCIGGVAMMLVLLRGVQGVRIERSELRPDVPIIRRMMRIGVPAAADALLMAIAQMAFLWVIFHSAIGDAATVNAAAHMIAMRIEAISFLPAMAWMTAAATLVGQYLGAMQPRLAMRAGHIAALQAMGMCTFVGIIFSTCASWIYAGMTNDPQVQAVGSAAFRFAGLIQPFLGAAIVYIGALRGAGDTRSTMLFSLIGSIGLRVPVAYLCAVVFGWGLIGAWIGMWTDNMVKFILGYARFASGAWQRTKV